MTTASRSNHKKKLELPSWVPEDWVKPDSCLAKVCGLECQMSEGLAFVKSLARQHKQLTILLENIVMKMTTERELIADWHG